MSKQKKEVCYLTGKVIEDKVYTIVRKEVCALLKPFIKHNEKVKSRNKKAKKHKRLMKRK